jgi:hypothetical protein
MKISFTTIKTIGVVVNVLRTFIPEELLVLVIDDEFLETTGTFFAVQYERSRLLLRFSIV